MANKKFQRLSTVALIASLLPLATFVPVLLNISLSDGTRTIWAAGNMVFAFLGVVLSVICVKNPESRSVMNIASTIISLIWVLNIGGILTLIIILNAL